MLTKKRIILYILAVLAVLGMVFGIRHASPKTEPTPPSYRVQKVVNDEVAEDNKFLLILQDGYLNLYQPNSTAPIASEKLNTKLFPKTDLNTLSDGVEYSDKNSAFSAMECYIE